MGGFRNRSELIPFVPHNPLVIGSTYIGGAAGFKVVSVEFDVPMDVTSLPDIPDWNVVADSVPFAVFAPLWFDATHLRWTYAGALDPVVDGFINLNVNDPACRDTNGTAANFPQTSQFFP